MARQSEIHMGKIPSAHGRGRYALLVRANIDRSVSENASAAANVLDTNVQQITRGKLVSIQLLDSQQAEEVCYREAFQGLSVAAILACLYWATRL